MNWLIVAIIVLVVVNTLLLGLLLMSFVRVQEQDAVNDTLINGIKCLEEKMELARIILWNKSGIHMPFTESELSKIAYSSRATSARTLRGNQ